MWMVCVSNIYNVCGATLMTNIFILTNNTSNPIDILTVGVSFIILLK